MSRVTGIRLATEKPFSKEAEGRSDHRTNSPPMRKSYRISFVSMRICIFVELAALDNDFRIARGGGVGVRADRQGTGGSRRGGFCSA